MPVWVWLFFLSLNAYLTFVLWRAWRHKFFKYGPIVWSLAEDPIYFWFWALVFTASELFALVFFILIIVSEIWGPIVHQ